MSRPPSASISCAPSLPSLESFGPARGPSVRASRTAPQSAPSLLKLLSHGSWRLAMDNYTRCIDLTPAHINIQMYVRAILNAWMKLLDLLTSVLNTLWPVILLVLRDGFSVIVAASETQNVSSAHLLTIKSHKYVRHYLLLWMNWLAWKSNSTSMLHRDLHNSLSLSYYTLL